jgi:ketosteroid isomerase-like protein
VARTPEETVRSYFDRFEAGDADGVAQLFTDTASLMPNGMETVIGRAAIRETFVSICAIVEMHCEELSIRRVQSRGDVAAVESSTREQIRRRSDGSVEMGAFRELFCLVYSGDDWKIAAYMGNAAKR